MFEDQKIKYLEKQNKELKERNVMLVDRINELNAKIADMESVVKAADTYAEEQAKVLRTAELAKERYKLAEQKMLMLMKEYQVKEKELMKTFSK